MKNLLFALLVALTAFTGCLTDSGSDKKDDSGGTSGGTTASDYMPLAIGNQWNFTTSTVSTTTESGSYTMSVTGTTTQNGKTYWVLNSTDEVDDTYLRLDGNILYQYQNMDFTAKNAAAKAALGKAIAEEQDLPMFNFSKSSGQTWSVFTQSGNMQGGTYSVTMTGKHGGTESVTTPAGTYSSCVKFIISMNATVSSQLYSSSWSYTQTMWFAKGVGPVKIVEEDKEEGYTSTTTDLLNSFQTGGGGGGNSTYNISGYIKDSLNKPIENVLVSITVSGQKHETYTDSDGEYLIIDIPNGTYTLTPSKAGYTFVPANLTVKVNNNDYSAASAIIGTKSGGGGTAEGTYFPTTEDATWDWKTVTRNAAGDLLYDDTYNVTMSISSAYGGKEFVLMDISNDYNDPFVRYESTENTAYFHYDDDSYIWFKVAANAETGGTFPFYKFGVAAQTTWNVFSNQYDENTLITCTGKYLGKESVTVQAGTFPDCAKILLTFTKTEKRYSLITDSYITEVTVLASLRWFAPGAGMIRKESTRTIDNVVSDITVDEVTSYNIP